MNVCIKFHGNQLNSSIYQILLVANKIQRNLSSRHNLLKISWQHIQLLFRYRPNNWQINAAISKTDILKLVVNIMYIMYNTCLFSAELYMLFMSPPLQRSVYIHRPMASEVIAIVTVVVNLINLTFLIRPARCRNVKHDERYRENKGRKNIPKQNTIMLPWQMIEIQIIWQLSKKKKNTCQCGCPHICLNLLLWQVHVCGNVIWATVISIIFNGCYTQAAPQQRY